jgi:hypothetical protein
MKSNLGALFKISKIKISTHPDTLKVRKIVVGVRNMQGTD